MTHDIIFAESRLFSPTDFLWDEFGVLLCVDLWSPQQYVLIKPNSMLQEFDNRVAKPILNDLVKELQIKYNYQIFISVKKTDKKGIEYTDQELFSSKHIKLDYLTVMYGQFQPHKPEVWERTDSYAYDFFNRFYKSDLLSLKKTTNTEIPVLFDKLLDNLTTNEIEKTALLNWIAVFYQTLRKSKVAWVIKGEKGTGKGILKNILGNIFGRQYLYSEINANSIVANFNAQWKDKLFIVFEEVDFNTVSKTDKSKINGKIKDIIVEKTINIEAKGKDMVPNYPFHSNILFFSNNDNPIVVEEGDRRLNMLNADTKLESRDWWVSGPGGTGDQLESKEMAREIAQYLRNYKCDLQMYDTLIKNDVWVEAIENNNDKEYIFCNKLLANDIEWFRDHSVLHKTKQPNSEYTWISFVNNILFNIEYTHNNMIRVDKTQLKNLFEAMFKYEPDLKKFNKKLDTAKQFTINGKKHMCYVWDYKDIQTQSEPELDMKIINGTDSSTKPPIEVEDMKQVIRKPIIRKNIKRLLIQEKK